VIAATRLEASAARRTVRDRARVVHAGVGFSRLPSRTFDGSVISCGLAGALARDLPTGTVLVPDQVLRPNGDRLVCDPELCAALRASASALGARVVRDPLVTTTSILHGAQRRFWADLGYAGVDMETGCIDAPRIAAVRVVLDTPQREISPAWSHPLAALTQPGVWRDLTWLPWEGPRCARLAARILAGALPEPARLP